LDKLDLKTIYNKLKRWFFLTIKNYEFRIKDKIFTKIFFINEKNSQMDVLRKIELKFKRIIKICIIIIFRFIEYLIKLNNCNT
jgi:hypothetical protein